MGLLMACISASAMGFGVFAGVCLVERLEFLKHSQAFRRAMGYQALVQTDQLAIGTSRINGMLIERMALKSRNEKLRAWQWKSRALWQIGLAQIDDLIEKAGLAGVINKRGVIAVRSSAACLLAFGGFLIGFLFSTIMAVLLMCVGFLIGFNAPYRAIKEEKRERAYQIERQLSQMIEVLVLGLRSGMSFDRSLELYRHYFDGGLARSLSLAQQQWTHGLASRDEALRRLAQSCESLLFGRAVESIIRSLRFGTSLAEGLSMLAVEARNVRKAKLEERIAKAPVKMLLPVGGLILPAMLILILGPVLLDLLAGF